ncbi:Hypothetical predicted protein, partial [Podarcis lilfordi]
MKGTTSAIPAREHLFNICTSCQPTRTHAMLWSSSEANYSTDMKIIYLVISISVKAGSLDKIALF